MSDVKCKCGSSNYRTETAGPHIKAVCNTCNRYIKFLPQGCDENTIMYMGVHKGKKLKDIPAEYFIWMHDNNVASGSLKSYIAKNLPTYRRIVHEAR